MADQCNAQRLFPTITYQLSVCIPSLKSFILGVIENNFSVPVKALQDQLWKLIIDPLLQLTEPLSSPMIVVVDTLNKCEDHRLVGNIIEHVAEALGILNLPL